MIWEGSVGFAIGAVIVTRVIDRRRERRRHLRHRERLLVEALSVERPEGSGSKRPPLSDKRLEMELLLLELHAAGTALGAALAAESGLGNNPGMGDLASKDCLAGWQEARRSVQRAQAIYDDAADAYHEFLQTLPPPLRTQAQERCARTVALSRR